MAEPASRPPMAEMLDLSPHPEGGWFRESWRSPVEFTPAGYDAPRASATCIYFVLGADEVSQWHRVRSTEIWLWHGGGPLHLSLAGDGDAPDAQPRTLTLGGDFSAGQVPQAVVPADVWQAARPAATDDVLVSCVVSPGFDFADFELAPEPASAAKSYSSPPDAPTHGS